MVYSACSDQFNAAPAGNREKVEIELPDCGTEPVTFGGPAPDIEHCPPEFRRSREFALPANAEAARRACIAAGVLAPPERVDIYQTGTLLCRLVTGRSVMAYLSSPGLVSSLPQAVRTLIDGCIGYDETSRVTSAAELVALLDSLAEQTSDGSVPTAAGLSDTNTAQSAKTDCAQRPVWRKLGQFELLEVIGRGGMGTVYRAHDTSLNRIVAVKVLSGRLARDAAFVERFKAEASAAARLTHDCIVPIYFIGEDQQQHFYAMRFVAGESLADRLHCRSRLPVDEALQIVEQTLTGLAVAHRQGIVHRDIKPGNIMIDGEHGRAMLTDFGLARSLTPETDAAGSEVTSDTVMGTAEYMSPEQARGEPVDQRSDLYSVGTVLYQLLSGTTPFDADTPAGHLMQHVCESPTPLEQVAPELPQGLSQIVTRLLQKQPGDRYATVEELLVDLGPFLAAGRSDGREPDSKALTDPTTAWIRGRSRLRVVAAFVILLLIGIGFWSQTPRQAASGVPLSVHRDAVTALTFSADGRFVISGGGATSSLKQAGDTSLRVWDAAAGTMMRQSPPLSVRPQQLIALPGSNRFVAFGSTRESTSTACVWNMTTGQLGATRFDESFSFHFAAVSDGPDSIIAAGHDGITELRIADEAISIERRFAVPADGPVRALAICPTRTVPLLLVATEANSMHVVLLIDLQTGESIGQLTGFHGPVIAVASTSDGSVIATRSTEPVDTMRRNGLSADFVSVWSSDTLERRFRSPPFAAASPSLQLTSDGRRLLTIGETTAFEGVTAIPSAALLDTSDGAEVCRYQTGGRFLTAVAIGPDDRTVAISDSDGNVVLSALPD
ncbi:MAG: WD40 repeat domain-containing serine/threonine protein kinase [Planctomycetota bacterium]